VVRDVCQKIVEIQFMLGIRFTYPAFDGVGGPLRQKHLAQHEHVSRRVVEELGRAIEKLERMRDED
jgi:hypothetical protein